MKKPSNKASRQFMAVDSQVMATYVYSAPAQPALTREEIMKPTFWGNLSNILRPGYVIRVLPKDFTYFAELLVTNVKPTAVTVHELTYQKIATTMAVIPLEQIKITFGGPAQNWRFQHIDEIVESGFNTKLECEGAARRYANNWSEEESFQFEEPPEEAPEDQAPKSEDKPDTGASKKQSEKAKASAA